MSRSLLPLLVLAGCDDFIAAGPTCPPAYTEIPGEGCVFDEDQVFELVRTFDEGAFVKVNTDPFTQIYGVLIQRNVWVTPVPLNPGGPTAADLYADIDPDDNLTPIEADFPVGTVIVHEAIDREEGHGVQVKREEGWVGEDGRGWWFGKIFDDGTYDLNACSPCETCHNESNRPVTDGLVGVTREAL